MGKVIPFPELCAQCRRGMGWCWTMRYITGGKTYCSTGCLEQRAVPSPSNGEKT